jgi:hypothetical protein
MSITLDQEQIDMVLRFAEPIKGRKREQFMQSLGQILEDGPGRDYIIAAIGLALDTIAIPAANADDVVGFKETQMT